MKTPVNIEPSIRTTHKFAAEGAVGECHYVVHAGKLVMLEDTTTPLTRDEPDHFGCGGPYGREIADLTGTPP